MSPHNTAHCNTIFCNTTLPNTIFHNTNCYNITHPCHNCCINTTKQNKTCHKSYLVYNTLQIAANMPIYLNPSHLLSIQAKLLQHNMVLDYTLQPHSATCCNNLSYQFCIQNIMILLIQRNIEILDS